MPGEYEIETTVDLDNIDEAAAEAALRRAGEGMKQEEGGERSTDTPTGEEKTPAFDTSSLEPSAEELASYSETVQRRINRLVRARNDERRAAEEAQRERDEAVQFAQRALTKAQQLEEQTRSLTDASTSSEIEKLDLSLAAARQEYIEAADAYNTEAMAEANLKLARLTAKKERLEEQKAARPVASQEKPVVQQQVPARPSPDSRAREWAARNEAWFQKDKAMTAFAFGVHEELVSDGVNPTTDADKYYRHLDEQLKKRFPERFESSQQTDTGKASRTSPVAPASRTVSGKQRVTLTAAEVALARRLGVTPEAFAAEKIKLEKANG